MPTTKYVRLVKQCPRLLTKAGMLKKAMDAAEMLDNPIFEYPPLTEMSRYDFRKMAEMREELYHILCSCFFAASLALPPLEPEFYEAELSEKGEDKHIADIDRIYQHASLQIVGRMNTSNPPKNSALIGALCLVLETFPQSGNGFSNISKRQMLAKLNQLLIEDCCEPVRPDYASLPKNAGSEMEMPSRPIRLVIVDDDISEIAKTVKSLLGWKGITIIPYHHDRNSPENIDAKPENKMGRLALEILTLNPDIVLMDEGLDNHIDGSKMISIILAAAITPGPKPVFVANTGGEDFGLKRAGAFPNCSKGRNLKPIASAIESFIADSTS